MTTLNNRSTSAFTLPTSKGPLNADANGNATVNPTDSYEEFPSHQSQSQSPSLPWLVEYWSSSFFRAPAMVMDQLLCTCSSADTVHNTTTTTTLDESCRINIDGVNHGVNGVGVVADIDNNDIASTSSILMTMSSNPIVETSPAKISKNKWDALRSVVASHDNSTDTKFNDYYGYYDEDVVTMASYNDHVAATTVATNDSNSLYPTKKTKSKKNKSKNKSKSKKNQYRDDNNNEGDDDVRMAPPSSSPTAQSEVGDGVFFTTSPPPSKRRSMTLHSCDSFEDQYIDTTNYMCASKSKSSDANANANATMETTPSILPRTPARHSRQQERSRRRAQQAQQFQTPPRRTTTSTSMNARTRTPPSPAMSAADTYSTVSLSQSFADEFDDDSPTFSYEHEHEHQQEDNIIEEEENLFLDRLAAEQLLSPLSPTSPRRTMLSSSSSRNNPFRRLKQRTTCLIEENNNNGHEEEKIEEEEYEKHNEENRRPSVVTKTTNKKRASHEQQDDNDNDDEYENDHSAFKYLVRMSPQNYRHKFNNNINIIGEKGGVEEIIIPQDNDNDVWSTASSSVLLPLHPHQRIIASLPQGNDYDYADDSGYTYFRDSLVQTMQQQQQQQHASPMFPEL